MAGPTPRGRREGRADAPDVAGEQTMVMFPKYECPQAELPSPSRVGEPTWEMALFYPHQGDWDDADFLSLDQSGMFGLELSDGCLRFLPPETRRSQSAGHFLVFALMDHLGRRHAFGRGYNLRVRERVSGVRHDFRQPDVIASITRSGFGPGFATAADFVAEVLSDDEASRRRDLEEKRLDYAEAGVPEYWIVDPDARTILQLQLADGRYEEVGTFGVDSTLNSSAIPNFSIALAEMFDGGAEA